MNFGNKHENYEILNLIGYGLAKFNMKFYYEFGFGTKTAFYEYLVELGVAETNETIKNRQDLFDPFFENGRKGWWQKGDTYIHRKIHIDNLYGYLDVTDFGAMVQTLLVNQFGANQPNKLVSPVIMSRYYQLQRTGLEAEIYFLRNFSKIQQFSEGSIEDARLFGDGYDFQIQVSKDYYLAEVKGIREKTGQFRMTEREFLKAQETKTCFGLVIICNLVGVPKMDIIFDPAQTIKFNKQITHHTQVSYQSNYFYK